MTWRGVGGLLGETNAHFPLPPSTQSTSKMSLGFERELGTKIGKALNLNEVCRIEIDDPLNFESNPREKLATLCGHCGHVVQTVGQNFPTGNRS